MGVTLEVADDLPSGQHGRKDGYMARRGDSVTSLVRRDTLLHGGLDVLSVQFAHYEVLIPDFDVDKQVENGDLELVR